MCVCMQYCRRGSYTSMCESVVISLLAAACMCTCGQRVLARPGAFSLRLPRWQSACLIFYRASHDSSTDLYRAEHGRQSMTERRRQLISLPDPAHGVLAHGKQTHLILPQYPSSTSRPSSMPSASETVAWKIWKARSRCLGETLD